MPDVRPTERKALVELTTTEGVTVPKDELSNSKTDVNSADAPDEAVPYASCFLLEEISAAAKAERAQAMCIEARTSQGQAFSGLADALEQQIDTMEKSLHEIGNRQLIFTDAIDAISRGA